MMNSENEYLRTQVSAIETTIDGMSARRQQILTKIGPISDENESKMRDLKEQLRIVSDENESLKSLNEKIQSSFVSEKEQKEKLESSLLDLRSELDKMRIDLERKTENLRKSSDSQRTMSARIRELESQQVSYSQQMDHYQEQISEKNRQIEKLRSIPVTPSVSVSSKEEKRLKERVTSLEQELRQSQKKAREYDILLPIFNDVETNYAILKSRDTTYEESVNALRLDHDAEITKLNLAIDAKDELIKRYETRIQQMMTQNQRAIRELGETEKVSSKAMQEMHRKLSVSSYDINSLREKCALLERDAREGRELKEAYEGSQLEVKTLRDRIELLDRVSQESIGRLKSVIHKKNELQVKLDGANILIKRYHEHIGEASMMEETITESSEDES
jgi:chromosome segregation ATPase